MSFIQMDKTAKVLNNYEVLATRAVCLRLVIEVSSLRDCLCFQEMLKALKSRGGYILLGKCVRLEINVLPLSP
jgi:hypothetical protein